MRYLILLLGLSWLLQSCESAGVVGEWLVAPAAGGEGTQGDAAVEAAGSLATTLVPAAGAVVPAAVGLLKVTLGMLAKARGGKSEA